MEHLEMSFVHWQDVMSLPLAVIIHVAGTAVRHPLLPVYLTPLTRICNP